MAEKGLALVLGLKPKGKGAPPPEGDEEASEPTADSESGEAEYKSLMVDSAKAGDWDAFADAVAGYVRACAGKG